ncbi:MAG: methionine-R-sulfoxide reductase [Actinobacteria bacterium 66_15]|nr:MAG: methionine-R-sulfoxide reductase [Actinobacteria bacterium 66_15]
MATAAGTIARTAVSLAIVLVLTGCSGVPGAGQAPDETASAEVPSAVGGEGEDMATIYFAGGCFWGLEKYFSLVNGVVATDVGYANGTTDTPSYEEVCSGRTGHAETVRVDYDPAVAPLSFLLELFYEAIDPVSVNRQGNDVGTQYRTGIYYTDPAERAVIDRSIASLQDGYDRPIAIEVAPLTNYFSAEGYHQDYLEKNPGGYCHIGFAEFEHARNARPTQEHFTR